MKQKTFVYVFIALLAVSLFLLIGRQLIIVPQIEKIDALTQQAATHKTQIAALNLQIDKIKKESVDAPRSMRLLPAGSEHEVLQTLISAASATGFLVESLALQPSFQRRRKPEDTEGEAGPPTLKPGELPQVDDNGNAIGMPTEEDENGPMVEVVPIRVQGKGAVRSWGLFLHRIRQELPLFGLREMTLQYSSAEPKGSFEIVIPLKTAAQASSGLPQPMTGGK